MDRLFQKHDGEEVVEILLVYKTSNSGVGHTTVSNILNFIFKIDNFRIGGAHSEGSNNKHHNITTQMTKD